MSAQAYYFDPAEKAILASFLLTPDSVSNFKNINPAWWSSNVARTIYKELLNMKFDGKESLIELVRRLTASRPDTQWMDVVTWIMADAHAQTYLLDEHVRLLQETAACRDASKLLLKASELAIARDVEGAARASADATEVLRGGVALSSSITTIGDAAAEIWEKVSVGKPSAVGLETGLGIFDEDYANQMFVRGRLVALVARPAMGKTALALQLALHVERTAPVTFWCGEMPADALTARVICAMSNVSGQRIAAGRLDTNELARVRDAVSRLTEVRIVFATKAATSIDGVNRAVDETVSKFGAPAMIVIDYVQRLKATRKHSNPEGEIAEIIMDLQAMGRDRDATMLCLMQLNRAVESDPGRRIRMSDIRGSGQLEQDADAILGLTRPSVYDENAPERLAIIDVIKNRHGPSGALIPLTFDGPAQTFSDDIDNGVN
jgi:replicative DNA helicase